MKKEKKDKSNSFFAEFKKFISHGKVLDLAVAVIIGGAFSAIVTSLVSDIIMPLVGGALGNSNFSQLTWNITDTIFINYGNFLKAIIDFLVISFVIFVFLYLMIRTEVHLNKLRKREVAETPKIETTEDILSDIRTLLMDLKKDEGVSEEKVEEN